ncbi:hypothetical protein Tco_0854336 [Tanacetum coccineum]
MSKTRGNYGSGVVRPKINEKTHFELKRQFLKELRENSFSGSEHEDTNDHIEKVLEIIDLFHIPEVTQYQVMLRAFPMSLTGAASRWLKNEPSCRMRTMQRTTLHKGLSTQGRGKTLEEAHYTQFGAPYQPGGHYRAAWPRFYQRNNGNSLYPDRRQTLEESLTKFMAESAKRHEEKSNIIKEIRASTDATIRNQGALIKTLEI